MPALASPVPRPNRVTSGYNAPRKGRRHGGLDFAVPVGTDVFALYDGKVRSVGKVKGGGLTVQIEHVMPLGYGTAISRYMHLSKATVYPGQKVLKGMPIAKSGADEAKAPHLHVDVLVDEAVAKKLAPILKADFASFVKHGSQYKLPLENAVPIDQGAGAGAPSKAKPKPTNGGIPWPLIALLLLFFSER